MNEKSSPDRDSDSRNEKYATQASEPDELAGRRASVALNIVENPLKVSNSGG